MATLTIVDGNLYITRGTVSGNVITYNTNELVTIHATKIDYNYDNQLQIIPIPNSKGNRDQTPTTRVVDIKRITEAISAHGFLEDEATESATVKRNNLLTLAKIGDPANSNTAELTIVWNSGNYQTLWQKGKPTVNDHGAFINKMMFSETAGKIGDADVTNDVAPERQIQVTIQLVRGKDI